MFRYEYGYMNVDVELCPNGNSNTFSNPHPQRRRRPNSQSLLCAIEFMQCPWVSIVHFVVCGIWFPPQQFRMLELVSLFLQFCSYCPIVCLLLVLFVLLFFVMLSFILLEIPQGISGEGTFFLLECPLTKLK